MHMLNFYVILQFSPTILKFPKFELKHRFSMVLTSDCSDTTAGSRTLSSQRAAEAHWACATPIQPGSRSKSHRKRKSRRNYLVQVSTCRFLLQLVNRLQESLVQFLYSCPPRFSSDRKSPTPFQSTSRLLLSQIRFSILPLSLRSNLILVEEEESKRWLKNPCLSQLAFSRRNHHKRILGKIRSKRTHSFLSSHSSCADFVHLVRHDAALGAS